jgi:putative redox protein
MSEYLVVQQNRNFETEFRAKDPHDPASDEVRPVVHIHELTPYSQLLGSLGACTAIVLNTYAQHHNLNLEKVELRLSYERVFQDDCENCENIDRYEEQIDQKLSLTGNLTESERQKLFQISKQCSIHKMLEDGIKIRSQLIDGRNIQ